MTQLQGYPLDQLVLMDRHTGRSIYDTDHLKLSIIDILTTPIGSRVMRRDYGSRLFQLLDRNINRLLKLNMINAIADSILRWEPRISELSDIIIKEVNIKDGHIRIDIRGVYRLDGRRLELKDLSLDFFAQNAYHLIRE